MRFGLFLTLALTEYISAADANVGTRVSDRQSGGFFERCYLADQIRPRALEDEISEAARKFANARLISMWVFTDRDDMGSQFKTTDSTWEATSIILHHSKLSPKASVIALNNDWVLRLRDADGEVSRKVLRGRDPLNVTIGANHYDIIHISASPIRSQQRGSSNESLALSVFAVVGPPATPVKARALAEYLLNALRYVNFSVHVRTDEWFFANPGYPYVPPFATSLRPPSMDDLRHASEAGCLSDASGLQCH